MSTQQQLPDTLQSFEPANNRPGKFYSLPALEKSGIGPVSRLPMCGCSHSCNTTTSLQWRTICRG